MKKLIMIMMMFLGLLAPKAVCAAPLSELIILCYHDIPKEVDLDNFGVDRDTFVNTVEYFRTHGFNFVSLQDVIDAKNGTKELPDKPVMLTFDDAYASYYDFVFPILKEYKIPSTLAVVSQWLNEKPKDVLLKLLTWDQLKEIAKSPLVEIVSHSHNLHAGAIYNPQGNNFASAVSRTYNPETKTYESDEVFNKRVLDDMLESKKELESNLGIKVRAIAWPYGRYSEESVAKAKEAGIEISFGLNDKRVAIDNDNIFERFLVHKNPTTIELMKFLGVNMDLPFHERIVQIDLDSVYDDNPEQIETNLGNLLERIKRLKPTAVYLQAFADPKGTGNISEVYFPNKVLPVRMDLFNRVAHQIRTRCEVEVYAWMPMLAFVLPDKVQTEHLRVRQFSQQTIELSSAWYERLSPFSPDVQKIVYDLYSDLAKYAHMDGIIFQDDGYLNDEEDFHPDAQKEYLKITDGKLKDPKTLSDEEKAAWTAVKTKRLIDFSEQLKIAVRKYRPEAKFARTLYAPVVLNPQSEAWFAQNYQEVLKNYDYTVIMAYPYMEDIKKRDFQSWFKQLVKAVKAVPQGINKTVFKIQTVDWNTKKPIKAEVLDSWLETLVAGGAYHLAYYPDDYVENKPDLAKIRLMMSKEDFPYKREK